MLRINVQGKPMALTFKHVIFDPPYGKYRGNTSAMLFELEEGGKIAYEKGVVRQGTALCIVPDRYEKEKGRRIALQKLFSFLTREERRDVFSQYDARIPKGVLKV